MTEIQKQKMIKLIHTQKTRAGIDDEAYYCILMGEAGVQSSRNLQTLAQFNAVITALNSVLTSQGKQPLDGSSRSIPRNIYPLVKRAERILGADMEKRLGGFMRKLGRQSVNDLSPQEIRKCHAFLTCIEHYGEK